MSLMEKLPTIKQTIDFVYADINCQPTIRYKNGTLARFHSSRQGLQLVLAQVNTRVEPASPRPTGVLNASTTSNPGEEASAIERADAIQATSNITNK